MNRGDQAIYQGYEVCLWPLEYIGITAGPGASNHVVQGVSNSGLYDNGWAVNPVRNLYAPVSMELVATSSSGNTQVWRSINEVWLPGYTTPQFITIGVAHCNNPPYTVIGSRVAQGDYFYSTGDYGASAYHVHFILEIGSRSSNFPVGYNAPYDTNIFYSPNPPETIADMFYILDTDEMRQSGGYNWITYEGTVTKKSVLESILYMNLNKKRRLKHVIYT